jgi:hypothetical protein
MSGHPRVLAADTTFTWDGVLQRLPRGQVLDVTPGSPLERAIGADRLVPMGAVAAQPPAVPADARSRLAETGVSNQSPLTAEPAAAADGTPEAEPLPVPETETAVPAEPANVPEPPVTDPVTDPALVPGTGSGLSNATVPPAAAQQTPPAPRKRAVRRTKDGIS